MIYEKYGERCTILRLASAKDIEFLEGRKPDRIDRGQLLRKSLVVISLNGSQYLYHRSSLVADGGDAEVNAAIEALAKPAEQPSEAPAEVAQTES